MKTMIFNSHKQNIQLGIVVRTLMMSRTYCVTPNQVTMQPIGKIVLPKDLIVLTIRWYHQVTGHPGSKGSINTYINDIIIEIYADLLTTSSAIIANEIN
jgi:hypothetical protein